MFPGESKGAWSSSDGIARVEVKLAHAQTAETVTVTLDEANDHVTPVSGSTDPTPRETVSNTKGLQNGIEGDFSPAPHSEPTD